MLSKVNFGHPKWPTAAILSKISKKIKVAYRSEMAQKCDQRLKFGHPKWPTSAILSKIKIINKVAYRCEMDINEIESDFRTSKMATGSHFVKKNQIFSKSVLI